MEEELKDLLDRWPIAGHFKLPLGSEIVVIGAYKGLTMGLLSELYPYYRRILGFEPQMWAYNLADERFKKHQRVSIYPWGLGTAPYRNGQVVSMGEFGTDACSFINTGPDSREQGNGLIRDYAIVAEELEIDHIDLMIMNIEGYEFELLPYLMELGLLENIDRLIIQFHLGFGNDSDYPQLLAELSDIYPRSITSAADLMIQLPTWGYWYR